MSPDYTSDEMAFVAVTPDHIDVFSLRLLLVILVIRISRLFFLIYLFILFYYILIFIY